MRWGSVISFSSIMTILGLVFVVPSSLVDLLDLIRHQDFEKLVSLLPLLLILGVSLTFSIVFLVFIPDIIGRQIAKSPSIAHLDQKLARKRLKFYKSTITHHMKILDLSVVEFANRAHLPIWKAWALIRNPDIIPREELWHAIEHALLLPDGFLQRGKGPRNSRYGQRCTIDRLRWYDEKKIAETNMLAGSNYDLISSGRLSAILRRIEEQRRIELKLPTTGR